MGCVNQTETLLLYQRLELRAELAAESVARLRRRIESDPEVDRLMAEISRLVALKAPLESALALRDDEVGAHRQRLRARERELMSGHVKNPSELIQMAAEVEHMKQALGQEEEGELGLIEETEKIDDEIAALNSRLDDLRRARAEAEPALLLEVEAKSAELESLESERDQAWERVGGPLQSEYRRLKSRLRDPVAEVVDLKCQACRVQVTSNAIQILRRADRVSCDNCDRLLVLA